MQLVEDQSEQLTGVLPKTYTMFADDLLRELLRIFNNKTIDEVGGDVIGRIYEYFLSKFHNAVTRVLVNPLIGHGSPTRFHHRHCLGVQTCC